MAAIVAATAVVALVPGVARAQTGTPPSGFGDPNRCATAADGGSGLDPNNGGAASGGGMGGGGGGSWGPGGSTPTTSPATSLRDDEEEHGICSSLVDAMMPGDNPGPYPSGNYDLGNSNGTRCVCAERRVSGMVMRWGFGLAVLITRFGLGFANFVGEFELAELLEPVATGLSDRYQTQIVDRLGLGAFFLFICGMWFAYYALSGRMLRGWSELGQSLVLGALTATVFAYPGSYLISGLRLSNELSAAMTAAATGQDTAVSSRDEAVTAPMLAAMHKVTIERPHQMLNWGPQFPSSPACAEVAEAAVASGPWGAAAAPRDAMKDAGCKQEASFNRDPSTDRILGAWMVAGVDFLVMLLVVLISITVLAAELGVLAAIALFPFAATAANLPGRGRSLWWWWVGFALASLTGVLVMGVLLSWVLAGMWVVLNLTGQLSMFMQLVLAAVIAGIGIVKRKDMLHGGKRAVSGFAQRMGSYRAGRGGGGTWAPALGGAAVGAAGSRLWQKVQRVERQWDNHQRRVERRERRQFVREQRDRARHEDQRGPRQRGPRQRVP